MCGVITPRIILVRARVPTIIPSRRRSNLAFLCDTDGVDGMTEVRTLEIHIGLTSGEDEHPVLPLVPNMKYSAGLSSLLAFAASASAGTTIWSGSFNSYSTASDFDKCRPQGPFERCRLTSSCRVMVKRSW